jgi:hypothetical protein
MKKYRRFRLITLLLVILTTVSFAQQHPEPARAQHQNNLRYCTFPAGSPYAGQNIFLRYVGTENRVALVSYNSGAEVATLDSGLDTPQFDVHDWSHDCRYVIATAGEWGQQTTIAYDAYEARKVGEIASGGMRYALPVQWSPANDYRLVMETLNGAFFWYLPENYQVRLAHSVSDEYGRNFQLSGWYYRRSSQINWDLARNRLLAVLQGREHGVTAYDLHTGQEVAFYHMGREDMGVTVRYFENYRYIILRPEGEVIDREGVNPVWVWDSDTGEVWPVIGTTTMFPHRVFFSPDRRYMALATPLTSGAGLNRPIFVWDLHNLQGEAPYLANHELVVGGWGSAFASTLRFNDDNTVDAAYYWWYNRCYGAEFTIWRWELGQTDAVYAEKFDNDGCNDPTIWNTDADPELLEWACSYSCR